jgi:hypothetical protein
MRHNLSFTLWQQNFLKIFIANRKPSWEQATNYFLGFIFQKNIIITHQQFKILFSVVLFIDFCSSIDFFFFSTFSKHKRKRNKKGVGRQPQNDTNKKKPTFFCMQTHWEKSNKILNSIYISKHEIDGPKKK